jgi:hypothetical protein
MEETCARLLIDGVAVGEEVSLRQQTGGYATWLVEAYGTAQRHERSSPFVSGCHRAKKE